MHIPQIINAVRCCYIVLTTAEAENIIGNRREVICMANTTITMRMDETLKAQLQELMADLGMKYPATLIFLDWFCEDPESAIASVRCSGG